MQFSMNQIKPETNARTAITKARDLALYAGDTQTAMMMQAILNQRDEGWQDSVNPKGELVRAIDTWVFG